MTKDPKTLVDILGIHATQSGEAIVVHNGYRTFRYSYATLHTLIQKASAWCVAEGIRKGDTIVIWGPNSIEWVVASLGALSVGAVVVPVDIQATLSTAQTIATRSQAKLLLKSKYRPQNMSGTTVVLEDFLHTIAPYAGIPASLVKEDDLAYIVYTSGTTGDPKGVMLTHANVTANVCGAVTHFSFGKRVRVLSTLPLSHMFEQVGGLWVPLLLGGTIVYPSAIVASVLFSLLKKEKITHMLVVPRLIEAMYMGVIGRAKESGRYDTLMKLSERASTLPLFVKKILFRKIHKAFGRHFEYMVSGGAPLSRSIATFWRNVGISIYEGYGLTETSPVIAATSPTDKAWGTVGKEFPRVSVRFSKEGEIEVRGPNVFTGYYHHEHATHDAFTDDGWFKTGDIGYKDDDANLVVSGRVKEMILSSSGINIFPDDIERVLLDDSRVKEACVVGVERDHGEAIHAVLILKDEHDDVKDIVQRANDTLSSAMRIQGYSLWHEREFPKTTTLKTKRIAVKRIISGATEGSATASSHRSKLYDLLASITGREASTIAPHQTLVSEVGLDSLGRVELISGIAREYNYELSEDMITPRTTVAEIEKYIQERKKTTQSLHGFQGIHTPVGRSLRALMSVLESAISACFITLKVIGREHIPDTHEPMMIVTNHVSSADHSVIIRALPYRYRYLLATPTADTYYYRPHAPLLTRLWYRGILFLVRVSAGAFILRQEDGFSASLKYAGHVVEGGESLLMFPEGRRSDNGELLPFMRGTAHLIRALKLPVVPIAHYGLSYVLKRNSIIPHSGTVTVAIGEPIQFTTETDDEIMATIRSRIEMLQKEAQDKNPYLPIYLARKDKI